MYYYTDYNTFKLILTNETLRFKESTSSNDRLDTIQLYKPIKDYIAEDNADKALETIQEIYSQFENIQQLPYIGVDLFKCVSFKTDYKYVVWNDYVVLYKVGKEVVEIYRVVNRYRDITGVIE